jgi:protein-disulfide isomerase
MTEEVEALVAGELMKVDQQRQEILEQGLEGLISQKLVEIEAEQNGLAVEALIQQQVDSKVTEPTGEEVDAFYEQRKASINKPKEEVSGQIVQYLLSQKRQNRAADYVSELRQKHNVRSFLEPLRIEVAASGSPSYGPEDAPVTIVEFSDFQCPFCSRVLPTFEAVKKNYGDQVRLVFRQFPLSNIHPQAQKAAEASLCADDQGKFWEMHDQMFSNQARLGVPQLKEVAAELGLEGAAFGECLDSGKYASQVRADLNAGTQAGVTGTPAMFINGRFLSGAQPYTRVASIIDDELSRLEQGD